MLSDCIDRKYCVPGLVCDGNFKMEHMIMKNPKDDVFLRDGRGFMVSAGDYDEHIRTSIETKEVGATNAMYIVQSPETPPPAI
jgi:hypothetical protein